MEQIYSCRIPIGEYRLQEEAEKVIATLKPRARAKGSSGTYELRLYIAGQTPRSLTAIANLQKFCEGRLAGQYHIEVIDLVEKPKLASRDQILAIPTLVRRSPGPVRKIIGDLSNMERVLAELDLHEEK